METATERYSKDTKFHQLVHTCLDTFRSKQFTPTELLAAVALASKMYFENHYRSLIPDKKYYHPPNITIKPPDIDKYIYYDNLINKEIYNNGKKRIPETK
jgi:hypothetical protein